MNFQDLCEAPAAGKAVRRTQASALNVRDQRPRDLQKRRECSFAVEVDFRFP
jgi:hypothetical protein